MKKPVEAIGRMRRAFGSAYLGCSADWKSILAYLDSLPGWPADLTRERLEELANNKYLVRDGQLNPAIKCADALRRLAAIAPKREKRKVEIWETPDRELRVFTMAPPRDFKMAPGWRKVGEAEIDA